MKSKLAIVPTSVARIRNTHHEQFHEVKEKHHCTPSVATLINSDCDCLPILITLFFFVIALGHRKRRPTSAQTTAEHMLGRAKPLVRFCPAQGLRLLGSQALCLTRPPFGGRCLPAPADSGVVNGRIFKLQRLVGHQVRLHLRWSNK